MRPPLTLMRTASQFRLPIRQTSKVCLLFTRAACGPSDLTSLHSLTPFLIRFHPSHSSQPRHQQKDQTQHSLPTPLSTQTDQETTIQHQQQQHPSEKEKMATPKPPTAFTARETELLTIAFQCLKSKPDVRSQNSPSSQAAAPPPPPPSPQTSPTSNLTNTLSPPHADRLHPLGPESAPQRRQIRPRQLRPAVQQDRRREIRRSRR